MGDRWRTAQDEYLAACVRKEAGLFRDIVIPDEYDPFICSNKAIQYKVRVSDPVKLDQNKRDTERRMVPGGPREPELPLGRDCLHPTMWASKLEATPYGRADKMMAEKPKSESQIAQQASTIPFNHFGFEKTRTAVDAEFPRPKRTYPNRR